MRTVDLLSASVAARAWGGRGVDRGARLIDDSSGIVENSLCSSHRAVPYGGEAVYRVVRGAGGTNFDALR